MSVRPWSKSKTQIWEVAAGKITSRIDHLTSEEPLEIRLAANEEQRTVALTMRTPGAEFELASGFLYGEGIIKSPDEVLRISFVDDPEIDFDQQYNIVNVELAGERLPDLERLERHFYTTSACGVCGKASLEAIRIKGCPEITSGPEVDSSMIYSLPEKLRGSQQVFEATGGLHAAALFDAKGNLVTMWEDVGRHNAVDKLVGWAFLEKKIPLHDHIVLVSGRSSYEILQKCLMASVPIVCAVSAPSSLAVAIAQEFGMTLIGFLRGERFNVYAGKERIPHSDG